MQVSEVTSYSFTVQWGTVECVHRNGEIAEYHVRYGEVSSEGRQVKIVSAEQGRETTVHGLNSSTEYSVDIAAVVSGASAGPTLYSDPVTITTYISTSVRHRLTHE